ncbi:hypothetical protein E2C01_032840 [Portunus trituberculatus]|uniref:Uncharacterized protein n=1 Tax=Portunus trituberculatus TaxID=210409 RepID=A0A5B7EWA7_PORTR|nr:hypothetical protein [Portunus trituberculatus]
MQAPAGSRPLWLLRLCSPPLGSQCGSRCCFSAGSLMLLELPRTVKRSPGAPICFSLHIDPSSSLPPWSRPCMESTTGELVCVLGSFSEVPEGRLVIIGLVQLEGTPSRGEAERPVTSGRLREDLR